MDILSPALSLEETYYAEGLALGQADGAKAGLVEGRQFGLEKGFEKSCSMGRLHGRSIIWNTRARTMPSTSSKVSNQSYGTDHNESNDPVGVKDAEQENMSLLSQLFGISNHPEENDLPEELRVPSGFETTYLPPFLEGVSMSRLQKHIATLYALTEPESLSIENTEEAVSDFDDRYRRAVAKGSIIRRLVGEDVDTGANSSASKSSSGARRAGGRITEAEEEVEDIVWNRTETTRSGGGDALGTDINLEIEIR